MDAQCDELACMAELSITLATADVRRREAVHIRSLKLGTREKWPYFGHTRLFANI